MDRILTLQQLIAELKQFNHKEFHAHHTWKPTHRNFTGNNHLQLQESMRQSHIRNNHWADIGQHVTLMPDGKFVTGRAFIKTPASIEGYNLGAFCCEVLGNFDVLGKVGTSENNLGYDKLEGAQLQSLVGLANFFDDKGKYIRFHRENSTKTCPGNGIDKTEFMSLVKSYGIVERKVDNMNILDVQKLCNKLGITDFEGKTLVEDGQAGKRTESARLKLKELLTMVLK